MCVFEVKLELWAGKLSVRFFLTNLTYDNLQLRASCPRMRDVSAATKIDENPRKFAKTHRKDPQGTAAENRRTVSPKLLKIEREYSVF